MTISPARRAEVIDALRRGTVPQAGLDLFAVGMERFERAIDEVTEAASRLIHDLSSAAPPRNREVEAAKARARARERYARAS